jgi:nucleotide-binding universal stress UspA family protein
MQTILVATDFSDNARNALNFAARFAQKMNASIILLHAYMLPTPVSEVPYMMVNVEEVQKENERLAREAVEKLQSQGIRASYLVRLGFPSDEIEAVTEDQPIDLVVMGMRGKGALEKWMGSTTTSAIKKLHTPILVVPHDAAYSSPQHVVYATDFGYTVGFHVYDPLISLLKLFGAQLHIVHVQKDPNAMTDKDIAGQIQLDPVFAAVPHEYHVVADSDVKHGITTYLEAHEADLLVMVTHEHSFLERLFGRSHTTAMVYNTQVPLLVLKDKKS